MRYNLNIRNRNLAVKTTKHRGRVTVVGVQHTADTCRERRTVLLGGRSVMGVGRKTTSNEIAKPRKSPTEVPMIQSMLQIWKTRAKFQVK